LFFVLFFARPNHRSPAALCASGKIGCGSEMLK